MCNICSQFPDSKSWHRPGLEHRDSHGHHPDCPFFGKEVTIAQSDQNVVKGIEEKTHSFTSSKENDNGNDF